MIGRQLAAPWSGSAVNGSLAGTWPRRAGRQSATSAATIPLIMRCAKAAYDDAGLRPWRATA